MYWLTSFQLLANNLTEFENKPIEVSYFFKDVQYEFSAEQELNSFTFNEGADKQLNIATLDWPPYIDRGLCNLGWSLQLAVAVLTSQNYQVNVHFFPWVRAVKMVESGKMEILFPEYFIEDSAPSDIFTNKKRRELLVQSNEFIGGNVAFIKRSNDPFIYNGNLKSIIGKSIGVVRGYQNTPEFDSMMDANLINVIEAVDEIQLLKLLAAKRVDLLVGDPSVFKHVIANADGDLQKRIAINDGIEVISPAIKYNYLYFAVSTKFAHWKKVLNDINLALIEFESSGETLRIYQQGSQCGNAY